MITYLLDDHVPAAESLSCRPGHNSACFASPAALAALRALPAESAAGGCHSDPSPNLSARGHVRALPGETARATSIQPASRVAYAATRRNPASGWGSKGPAMD